MEFHNILFMLSYFIQKGKTHDSSNEEKKKNISIVGIRQSEKKTTHIASDSLLFLLTITLKRIELSVQFYMLKFSSVH